MHNRAKLDTLRICRNKHLLGLLHNCVKDPDYIDTLTHVTHVGVATLLKVSYVKIVRLKSHHLFYGEHPGTYYQHV